MRILVVLSLITTLFSPMMATKAEAQCLLCGVVGFALGSASNDEQAGTSSGSNVIYVAPHISERIADPLAVRIEASEQLAMGDGEDWNPRKVTLMAGKTLQEIFNASVTNSENFTILEVMRVIEPEDTRVAVFWFAYIENGKMRPLSDVK